MRTTLVSSGSSESSAARTEGASTRMMPPGHLLSRQALRGQDGLERLGPGLILDLGGDFTLDVLAQDDGPTAEGGEAGHHVGDVGPVPHHRDPGLLGGDAGQPGGGELNFGLAARRLGAGS